MAKLHLQDIINSPLNKPQDSVSAKTVMGIMDSPRTTPAEEPLQTMKLHIEISSYGKNGDAFHLAGEVYNQDDLAAIHDRFKGYMPRRKLWGVL